MLESKPNSIIAGQRGAKTFTVKKNSSKKGVNITGLEVLGEVETVGVGDSFEVKPSIFINSEYVIFPFLPACNSVRVGSVTHC